MRIGGAADLSPSTKTNLTFEGAGAFEACDHAGRNMHFGAREHAMGSIANGIALSHLRRLGAARQVAAEVRLHAKQRADGGAPTHEGTHIMKNPLQQLHEAGLAVWLDFVDRKFLVEGGLASSSRKTR